MYAYKDFVSKSNEELVMCFLDAYFPNEPLKDSLWKHFFTFDAFKELDEYIDIVSNMYV